MLGRPDGCFENCSQSRGSAAVKLTNARLEMLRQLAREPGSYAESYPPLRALLAAGLARKTIRATSDRYEITESGRKVLEQK